MSDDQMDNEDTPVGLLFEIVYKSDIRRGSVCTDLPPSLGATYNEDEKRWEKRLFSVQELAQLAYDNDANLRLCFPSSVEDTGDLPIIEIEDD